MRGSRSLAIISGRRAGWVKRARIGDISGGEGVKEEPELLPSKSAFVLQITYYQAASDLNG